MWGNRTPDEVGKPYTHPVGLATLLVEILRKGIGRASRVALF